MILFRRPTKASRVKILLLIGSYFLILGTITIVMIEIGYVRNYQRPSIIVRKNILKLVTIGNDKLLSNPELSKHLFRYDPSKPSNYTSTKDYNSNGKWKRTMSRYIMQRLKNKTDGFFVECGAYDGERLSNTLMLEELYNWSGLLIESDKAIVPKLIGRNRRAWVADVCLSPKPYPMKVTMKGANNLDVLSYLPGFTIKSINKTRKAFPRSFQVQCYPLHMLLDTLRRSEVDYFSLDVEGIELDVLKTIPWARLRIKLISVEFRPESRNKIKTYLESVGYKKIHEIVKPKEYIHDDVYELIQIDSY